MSIYIGNDLEDRLKALEMENASLKKYSDYHQVLHEIDHLSDSNVDSSFQKQSMEIDSYLKVTEWVDSSIGQSTVIQELEVKRPKLSSLNQTQNRRRYINFENGSHFICSLNLKNPELTIFIAFKMTDIASGNQEFVNSLIGNTTEKITAKLITFYRTYSDLGLLISKARVGSYVAIANDDSSLIPEPDLKFPASKSNCTDLNKWHIISVTWSNKEENLSDCWSTGEKLMTFTMGNSKGSDYCYIGDLAIMPGLKETHLTGCIGEIIAFRGALNDKKSLHIHEHLMKKWGITDKVASY